jgi:acyl-CoA synthetase (AMP-forming)/AMP-acid ligase II
MPILPPSLLADLPATSRMVSKRHGLELDAVAIAAAVGRREKELSALGLSHGARIVIGEADPVDFLVSLLASWRAGLAAVAVNPALTGPEQANVLETSGAGAWLGELRTEPPVVPGQKAGDTTPLSSDEPALILMTSGTTGRPKGIAHSLRSLAARIERNIAEIGVETPSETLCVLPVFFGHGLIGNADATAGRRQGALLADADGG